MKYEVWHAKNPTFGFGDKPVFPEAYNKIAIVEADAIDIDDVFRITNHIDSDWAKNPEVIELFHNRPRSTSVGDVVVDGIGSKFYCDTVGWTEVREN